MDGNLYRDGSWLSVLFKLRNTGMHRAILNLGFSASSKQVSFVGLREPIAAIPYLEKAIRQMKDLITGIVNKDTLLRISELRLHLFLIFAIVLLLFPTSILGSLDYFSACILILGMNAVKNPIPRAGYTNRYCYTEIVSK